MSFLKGTIRSSNRTQLGSSMNAMKGSTAKAMNEQYTMGETKPVNGYISEVLQRDMGEGKEFFPFVKVLLVSEGGTTEWPYWLRLVDPPRDMGDNGGLKGLSIDKPKVKVWFTSSTRRRGFVSLNAPGAELDEYSDGQIAESEGFDMV